MSDRAGRNGLGDTPTGPTAGPGSDDAAAGIATIGPAPVLPAGRIPTIGMREIVAALHRRRTRRREVATELRHALDLLSGRVQRHLERIAELREAVEKHGGDLAPLQHYDNLMARLRNELRAAERALAEAFRAAAEGDSVPSGS